MGQGGGGIILSMIAFALVWGVVIRQLPLSYPHARFGGCNAVTLIRAGLVSVLLAPLAGPDLATSQMGWLLLGISIVSLSLDGVDGWLARKSGLVSAFGARFDMEVDAAFAAVLCVLALALDKAGLWLLALGFMRYAFVAAALVWPWLLNPLPERFSRKVVCVLQIAALIALLAPVVQPPVSQGVALVALLALIWSFAIDILGLAR